VAGFRVFIAHTAWTHDGSQSRGYKTSIIEAFNVLSVANVANGLITIFSADSGVFLVKRPPFGNDLVLMLFVLESRLLGYLVRLKSGRSASKIFYSRRKKKLAAEKFSATIRAF